MHRLGAHRCSPSAILGLSLSIALMIMELLPVASSIDVTVGPVTRNRIHPLSLAMTKHFGHNKIFTVRIDRFTGGIGGQGLIMGPLIVVIQSCSIHS